MNLPLRKPADVSDAEWQAMNREFWRQVLEPTDEEIRSSIANLQSKIAAFEKQHGILSEDMRQALYYGEVEETNDVCKWLMELNTLDQMKERLPQYFENDA